MTKWVTKKLGEGLVKSICTGKLDANAMVEGGAYRFYTCAKNYSFIDEYAFDDEALLISGNGEYVGYVHYYKGKFNAYQRTYVLRNFSIDIHFLQCYLNYFLRDRIKKEMNAGSIPFIKMGTLTEMPITYPESLAEQRRIAGILSSADGAIAASEALIEKYRNIKRGLLATLLQPKEGWKKVKLGECCETELGKTLDSGRNTGKYRPYLCALNVLWGKIDLSTIKQMRIEESEKERYLVKRGDLLVCEGGEIGRCAIWNSDEEIYYQNALHRVRFKEEYDAMFFMYLLGYYNDLNLIEQYGKGLTIKHLNQTSFRAIPVFIPDLTEQRRIAEILSSVDAKIAAEEKIVEKYKGVKKGLMEEMMGRE